ncbi:transketolase [Leptogranulimonas caecicola]|uniref:Transketolase n=1 Tax=Leptogranulimonas caecicola TaxID=2894156 RepID=A0AAU9CDG8_9ACTN|nr:transketolase [Leptogranulimonas caecicola]BCV19558.1 transketolase [Atopobiaceae bacterium P1]BDC90222.1 transketolase [Leptogranulimonas caecicola]
MQEQELKSIQLLATKIRRDVMQMLLPLGSGHLGGSYSIADLMALLYGKVLKVDPSNPRWEDRDRVVLSKGHAGPAWYAALAETGFFDRDMLMTLNQGHTDLPSHPDRLKTPGVDMTTGSLGQGCSTAAGIAYAQRLKGTDTYTYLIVGDGELNEGQCWEAFEFIAANRLNRCIVIIDDNKKQLDGYTKDVLNPFDISQKMRAFGFYTQTVNGQDVEALDAAITEAKHHEDSAVAIVMDTVKGAGVPYFEQLMSNHSPKFDAPAKAAAEEAIAQFTAIIEGSEA